MRFLIVISLFISCNTWGKDKPVDARGKEIVFNLSDSISANELKEIETLVLTKSIEMKSLIKVVIYEDMRQVALQPWNDELLQQHHLHMIKGEVILFLFDRKNNKGKVILSTQLNSLFGPDYKEILESQLLDEVLKTEGMARAITLTIEEIYKAKGLRKVADENVDNAGFVFWLFVNLSVSIIYFALYVRKTLKTELINFERVEFFSLSRFSKLQRTLLYVGAVVFYLIIYYFTVFDYDNIIILFLIMAGISFAPMANFTLYFWNIISSLFVKADKNQLPISLTIPEKKLLLNPKTGGFELLKLTFADMLLSKVIEVEIEERELRNNRVSRTYIVSKGVNFSSQLYNGFNKIFLKTLEKLEDDEGLYLAAYSSIIANKTNGLKFYKKNVARELVEKGLFLKWAWLFNIFTLSTESKTIRRRIIKESSYQPQSFNINLLLSDQYITLLSKLESETEVDDFFKWRESIILFNKYVGNRKWQDAKADYPEE